MVSQMSLDTKSPNDISTFSVSSLITIPAAVLQDLLGATQELKDEVTVLKNELAILHEKDKEIEKQQDNLAENQLIQLRIISGLKEDMSAAEPPATTKKTTDHVDDLYRLMVEDRSQQVSIAKAARLLGISKERMRQLKPLILRDSRFEMGWGQVKGKKAMVIRIRRFL